VLRPTTLRAYAVEAGFGDVQTLPIENDDVALLPPGRLAASAPACRLAPHVVVGPAVEIRKSP